MKIGDWAKFKEGDREEILPIIGFDNKFVCVLIIPGSRLYPNDGGAVSEYAIERYRVDRRYKDKRYWVLYIERSGEVVKSLGTHTFCETCGTKPK